MRAVYNIDSRVQFIVTVALLIEIAGTLTASSTSPRFASLTSFNNAKGQEVHISPAFCLGVVLVLGATWLRRTCFSMMGSQFTFQMSIKKQHRLVTNGPYAVVRHPSYTALLMLTIGLTLCEFSDGMWWSCAGIHQTVLGKILCLAWVWTVIHICMIATRGWKEDAFLRREFGSQWESYARNVRFLFFPGLICASSPQPLKPSAKIYSQKRAILPTFIM